MFLEVSGESTFAPKLAFAKRAAAAGRGCMYFIDVSLQVIFATKGLATSSK